MLREILFASLAMAMVNTALPAETVSVRAEYRGSPELPDGIAFEQFLALVASNGVEHDMALEHVAKALGVALDEAGQRYAGKRVDYFMKIRQQLLDEKASIRKRVLCTDRYRQRSADDTYRVLNDLDDLNEIIASKYHALSLRELTAIERDRFDEYLQERKLSITYVKTDARRDGAELELLVSSIEQSCNDMEVNQ